ncbi:MAG: PQQ-binding-like beta-propeller repeat protein [Bacteroidetes bacterium]|jgi:outer membrane protein assembly factor BamB|nr:PQQ-binding-like beta-propeller repeat protein [Bacteroidota bacterium]MBT5529490.1 PQQ-binding-like beta-propeller repeat protein [Cytophagia bacterium]MBT3424419.1 PQQ-binding-like beta-propeller repeat protein [Bacteroidota bacterium]MBT3802256.1 PQQ-binding-like beta-propeller repeat protein [Bacteroidota bacterium]MBT4337335.1 PQQ-binding-like beta-propeller repeat protein [Bacteroidota bacterium]
MQLRTYIILILSLLGIGALAFWFMYNPSKNIVKSDPGMDERINLDSLINENIEIGKEFVEFAQEESKLTGRWDAFRGPNRDNINTENIKLINSFEGKPEILWKVDLGEGHAAPAIYNGKVYILDYNEETKQDELRCFGLETGQELWKRSYNVHVKRNHGMSRTIPAVTDKYVVTIGPRGHVMCSNSQNGDFLWGIDLVKDYETEIPYWYTGQCPLIENDVAILAPGGKNLMIGVSCETGEIIWKTENPDNWQMSHSSIMTMTIHGKKMFVYAAVGGIVGISAEEESLGKTQWKTKEFAPSVVAPSPILLDNNRIFITAGYGAGSMLFEVTKINEIKIIQHFKPKDGLASEQQTPIFYQDHVFGVLPKDAGQNRNQFVCYNQDDCQTIKWASGKTERFGLGPYAIADGKFFILNDDGTLLIAKLSTKGFTLLDRAKILEGHDAWGPLAFADGYLLLRDSKSMVCLNIKLEN